jgi:2-dehydropantoate 2-reductase
MRIAILGAGAMGSVYGGHLALAGHDVTLVDVRREHMEAVARNGLEMRRTGMEPLHAHPRAIHDASELEPVELVIVLTKGFANEEAGRSILHAVGPDTWIATVQNGLGNERTLANVFGPDRVIPGTTGVGGELVEPGVVWMTPATAETKSITHLGPPRSADALPDGVREVARILTEAGLPTQALDDADVLIWTKLAAAATMGTVGGILRRTVREIIENEHGRALVKALFDEIVAVAHASGVALDGPATWEHVDEMWRSAGPHYPSMATDVLQKRRTEADTFTGELMRLGEQHGVPTPVSRTCWHMLKAIEETYDTTPADGAAGA